MVHNFLQKENWLLYCVHLGLNVSSMSFIYQNSSVYIMSLQFDFQLVTHNIFRIYDGFVFLLS